MCVSIAVQIAAALESCSLFLNGNLLARFQRAFVKRGAMTPGIASLNPGLTS